jgi:hypothetical protein
MTDISNPPLAINVPAPHFGKRINIKHLQMIGEQIKPIMTNDITRYSNLSNSAS